MLFAPHLHNIANNSHNDGTLTIDDLLRIMSAEMGFSNADAEVKCKELMAVIDRPETVFTDIGFCRFIDHPFQISVYEVAHRLPLEEFILKASLKVEDLNLTKKLRQALLLKDDAHVRQILNAPDVKKAKLNECLFDAISERNYNFVKLLLEYGASPAFV